MQHLSNPHRAAAPLLPDVPIPSVDADAVASRLADCPAHGQTPLVRVDGLIDVANLWVKDERARMGLGSFKALGAAYVIARDAEDGVAKGRTYVTASAGNHGMSVAAGARVFGAQSVVYIAQTVPEVFAKRLATEGAQVIRAGADYAASMAAAQEAADQNGWTLLSDSSWPDYFAIPHRLMEGYLQLAVEAVVQMDAPPTHIFLQAGVGGLAGAVAAYARHVWGDDPRIIVVEPDAAPALMESVRTGEAVVTQGPDSNMGRLDCKEPSLIALNGLARDADDFVTISDQDAADAMPALAAMGLATSPSGGAGLVAAMLAENDLGLSADSRVFCILSEGPA